MVQSSWASFLVMAVVTPLIISASMVRDPSDEEQQFLKVPASMRHRLASVSRTPVNQEKEVDVKIKSLFNWCYKCEGDDKSKCADDNYDDKTVDKVKDCCYTSIYDNGNVTRGTCSEDVHSDGECIPDEDAGTTTCYCAGNKCNDHLCQQCFETSTGPTDPSADPSESTTDPSVSITGLSESPTDPSVSSTGPSESTTDPSVSSTDPSESSTDPSESTTDPSVSSTGPSESTTDPSVSSTDPSVSTETSRISTDATTPTPPSIDTEKDLFDETKVALDSIKASYEDLLSLTADLMGTTLTPTITIPSSSTEDSTSITAPALNALFDLTLTTDAACGDMCLNITATMDRIQDTTNGIDKWTLEDNKLTELNDDSIILKTQVDGAKLNPDLIKDDADYMHEKVDEKNNDLDDTIKDVDDKIKEFEDQNSNSIILVSVIGGVGGLIVIALLGTSIYVCISKGKKDKKVGLDGPAADISMEELDKPETQEPRNAPARDAPNESQPLNPYTMNPLREQATDMRRSPSARDPYAAQPARTPPSDIERSAGTRGEYSDQPQRYPPRNLERSTSSRDPNIPSEPRGLNRNQDPFVHQSPKKQAPVVPKKPQGYSRQNSYNGQQQSSRSRLESSDSNGYGIPRATPDPRVPRGRAGPPHDDRPRGAGPHDDRPRGAGPRDDRPRGAGPHDDRPRGAGPSRDPYSQPPHRGGSRPANNSNYY